MRIWAFVSQKGGSGKSTLCTQIAVYAGQIGEKVIILDLDPQASAHAWHLARGAGESPAVVRSLPEKLPQVMAAIRDTGAFTLVLIDTAPHTNRAAVEAIRVADVLICPTRASNFDLMSLRDTSAILDSMSAKDRAVVVLNAVHGKGKEAARARMAVQGERLGIFTAQIVVVDRVAFIKATDSGRGVTEKGYDTDAANDVQKLWAEINAHWPVMAKKEVANDV
jgi:chromosome partitioning protein